VPTYIDAFIIRNFFIFPCFYGGNLELINIEKIKIDDEFNSYIIELAREEVELVYF
jgi:hypothetical protein